MARGIFGEVATIPAQAQVQIVKKAKAVIGFRHDVTAKVLVLQLYNY